MIDMVDGIINRIRAETGSDPYVIATGGLADLIAKESKTIQEVDHYLTLEGLKELYKMNKA